MHVGYYNWNRKNQLLHMDKQPICILNILNIRLQNTNMLGIRGSLEVEAMLIVWKTSNLGSISTSSTIWKIGLNLRSLGIDRGGMVEVDWRDKYMTHAKKQ